MNRCDKCGLLVDKLHLFAQDSTTGEELRYCKECMEGDKQYELRDWTGGRAGNTEQIHVPLMELGLRLNPRNDLVIWEVDETHARRVFGVITNGKFKFLRG